MTLRALDVLAAADLVLAEDTRVSAKLLSAYGLKARLERCDDHASARAAELAIERVQAGEVVALVSDAGTPMVSDPGFVVARAMIAAGLPVHPIPGASSLLAALMLAGQPADRVLFAGFLPAKSAARRTMLAELKPGRQTVGRLRERTTAARLPDRHGRGAGAPASRRRSRTDQDVRGMRSRYPGRTGRRSASGWAQGRDRRRHRTGRDRGRQRRRCRCCADRGHGPAGSGRGGIRRSRRRWTCPASRFTAARWSFRAGDETRPGARPETRSHGPRRPGDRRWAVRHTGRGTRLNGSLPRG